jgi:uncharacterized protein YuzE
MRITYDPEVDAIYIQLRPLAPGTARCKNLGDDVTVDYGPDGKLAGIEVLDASALMGEGHDRVVLEIAPALRVKAG